MGWLIAYGVGVVLVLVLCGAAFGGNFSPSKLIRSLFLAASWPVVLPILVGAFLRGMFS